MSRDYKSQKSSKSSSEKGGSAFFGGFVGYALGIMSAIGIWLYLSYAPSPYLSDDKNPTAAVKKDTQPSPEKSTAAEKVMPETPITVVEEKPRFDFYKILPGIDEPEVDHPSTQRATQSPSPNTKPQENNTVKSAEKPALQAITPPNVHPKELMQSPQTVPSAIKNNATATTKEKFILQAGSFRTISDAENLKARLALLGILASIQPIDLSGKGTWYRVRVGPFTQKEDADQTNASLRVNGITAQFIKTQ